MDSLLDAYQLFHDGALALAEVERAGIRIDTEYCREKLAWLDEQSSRYERRLRLSELGRAWLARFGSAASFGSGPQLQAVLYADLGVKPFKQTASGQDSVDEESLRQTGVDGINHLLRLRSLKKMSDVLGGFLRYQIAGYLYPTFCLHTVVTYRSSSLKPNLQNVPVRDKEQMDICRRAIVPSPGNVILEIDKSGIEVCVAACYHKDPTMLEYLHDPASDMHSDAAKKLFFLDGAVSDLKKLDGFSPVLRQAGKNAFIFPEFYGDYYESCAPGIACGWCKLPRIGDWTDYDGALLDGVPIARHLRRHDVSGLVDFTEHVRKVEDWLWNERFPVYSRWRKDWYARYQRRGSFRMKTGFECSGVMGRNEAVNYPVQGPAFHLLLKTLILVVQRIRSWPSKVVSQVHDSLLIDTPLDRVPALVEMVRRIDAEELPRIWPWIIVPLRDEAKVSEVDGSWANMRVVE
jgi:DNA polymerase-1